MFALHASKSGRAKVIHGNDSGSGRVQTVESYRTGHRLVAGLADLAGRGILVN